MILLLAFVFIESRAAHPVVPLSIFKMKTLSAANGIAVTVGAALFGMYFFLSLYLQQINGYSPLKAGLAFLPAGLATMAGALTAARLVARIGPRRQLVTGLLLAAAGLAWMSTVAAHAGYFAHVFGPVVLVGVGLGLSFVPMTMAATTGVPPHEAGLASGLINTSRQVGGAVGLAAHGHRGLERGAGTSGHRRCGPGRPDQRLRPGLRLPRPRWSSGPRWRCCFPAWCGAAREPREAFDHDTAGNGGAEIIAVAEA